MTLNVKFESQEEKMQLRVPEETVRVPVDNVTDYQKLQNKPSINGEVLEGDKSFEDFGRRTINNMEIIKIVDKQFAEIFGG